MKMIYRCDLCGAEFDDWDSAFNCESSHVRACYSDVVEEVEYKGTYPTRINVRMDNGAVIEYTMKKVVQVAPEPKPEQSEE